MPLIEVRGVSKSYPARPGARALLGRGGLAGRLRRGAAPRPVLEGVDFSIEAGQSLGIIGRNGSGKSTLLKLLAGVSLPSSGRVIVRGRVASLLELGAGFHPMLTGRENVYLNAGLLGMRHASVDRVFDDIVAFSGIGDYIDHPVDTYSSGMYVRIAFAVAVFANPDIFLVDEVLAVGDEAFQRQCRSKIAELRQQGKTIVFVSHDLGLVHALCDRIVLLANGRMIDRETPQATIDYYLRQVGDEAGIHTFCDGPCEAVFSHGRIALFRGRHEVTAPGGLRANVLTLGQYHGSDGAEWRVTRREGGACEAEALLPRLPVRLLWAMRWEAQRLHWRMAAECLAPLAVDNLLANIGLVAAYRDWWYGGRHGEFAAPPPGQTAAMPAVYAEPGCRSGAFSAGAESPLPPVLVAFDSSYPYTDLQFLNGPHAEGARYAIVAAHRPGGGALPAGRFDFAEIVLDLGRDAAGFAAWLDAESARGAVRSGALDAVFRQGAVALSWGGCPVTAGLHLHTQVRAGDLWTMSHDLQWPQPQRDGGAVLVAGASQRLPYRVHWRIAPAPEGIEFRAAIEALEPLALQEFNVSIALDPGYDAWESPAESGAFPAFDPARQDWQHLNRSYAPGAWLRATGPALPALALRNAAGAPPFRPTAINTGFTQRLRVLQAIAAPEPGAPMLLAPGTHTLFDGTVAVTGEAGA